MDTRINTGASASGRRGRAYFHGVRGALRAGLWGSLWGGFWGCLLSAIFIDAHDTADTGYIAALLLSTVAVSLIVGAFCATGAAFDSLLINGAKPIDQMDGA